MNKKSSSFFRLDEQVFFTMGGLCLLCLLVMAFRYGTRTPCLPFKISINSSSLIAGKVIRFDAAASQGKTFSWNFGDNGTKEEDISITSHTYKSAGHYTVSVLVNGQCTDMQDVFISDAPVTVVNDFKPVISVTDTIYINQPVKFYDLSSASTQWEWRFGQTTLVDARERNPSYTYTVPGRYNVILTVNGRPEMYEEYPVIVQEKQAVKIPVVKENAARPAYPPPVILKPQPGPGVDPIKAPQTEVAKPVVPEKPKVQALTNDQMKAMLMQVAKGEKTAQDFSEYFGGQLGTQVQFNSDLMPFTDVCAALKKMGNDVKEINVTNPVLNQANVIVNMTVLVKKKGFFKRILGKKS